MAQDYNIYLHATENNVAEEQTTPQVNRTDKNIDGTSRDTSALENFTKVKDSISSFASSGFEGLVEQGITMLGKAVPWVAIAYAVFKITDSVIDTTLANINEYTGHYQYAIGYNNFKAGIKNVLLPVSYAKRQIELNFQLEKQNLQIAQNRTLVGSATLRDFKIGV